MCACWVGNNKIINILINNGAEAVGNNKEIPSAFHIIVTKNNMDLLLEFINKFPNDINHQDKMGWTPLHFCAQYNNITIAELLLQEGAKVNIIDCYGNNPLWYAVFNANDDYCLVKLLVKYGADALSKNNAMRSPLDFAKQIKDMEMINILTDKKSKF